MEHIQAHKAIYKKARELGYKSLASHIKKTGPLKITVSKMDFIPHLVKIIDSC